ncbi:GAF domain-containing sensor histidine kinase [Alicyclobacillus macrosporangiidus]|uniref:GAF domain-containing sensor histidine kinase n=1 Tax=Alicyclobacillus macrosporangiidus TaxID=392015 RepID=UPI00068F7230|nr:GAF domain-containing sensor histidine kinase [Alicyclobacillus macrosporangiidus]
MRDPNGSDRESWPEPARLAMLKDIAEALNEATDISEAMDAILPRLSGVLGLSTAWAFRYDAERSRFVEVGASGLPPALACDGGAPLKSGWCECQDRFVEGRLDRAVNIVRCSRLRDAVGDKGGLTYHASVPLRSKGKPLGILNVAAAGHSVFTPSALQLLTAIGHHVAVAVDRAAILADERRRAEQLRALSDIAAELVSVVRPRAVLELAVRQFVDRLGYECCGITFREPGDPEAEALGSGWPGRVVASAYRSSDGEPAGYSYAREEEEPLLDEAQRVLLPQARSAMVRPIPHSPYEVRVESRRPGAFSASDEEMLSAFAWHVAASLENARLYEQSLEEARWVERRRLAADLHDAVSQRLFSAQLLARTARLMAERGHAERRLDGVLERLEALIADSQHEMRGLIEALRPAGERGLVARVRERIAPLQLQGQTRIHLTVAGDGGEEPAIPFEARESLLSALDEALHNALRHAGARNVHVHLRLTAEEVEVSVQDDGCGFHPEKTAAGLGTSTMYERMREAGGRLSITSHPGRGTRVVFTVPVPGDPAKGRER